MGQACHECEGNSRRIRPVSPDLLENAEPYPQILSLDNEEVPLDHVLKISPGSSKCSLDVHQHLLSLRFQVPFADYGARFIN